MSITVSDTTFIYGLLCPVENKIRYVGQTTEPPRRFRQHLQGHGRSTSSWIGWLRDKNLSPKLVILEEVDGQYDMFTRMLPQVRKAEQKWTRRLLSEGHPLLNHEKRSVRAQDEGKAIIDDALDLGRQMFG